METGFHRLTEFHAVFLLTAFNTFEVQAYGTASSDEGAVGSLYPACGKIHEREGRSASATPQPRDDTKKRVVPFRGGL